MSVFASVERLLDQLSSPSWQACLVAAVGTFLLLIRRYRTGSLLILFASSWVYLCATPAFSTWLKRGLENQYPPREISSYPVADAVVVLGGGELPVLGKPSANKASTLRATRVGLGLELLRQGRAPIILLSGSDHETRRMTSLLEQQRVPGAALRVEDASHDTYENAIHSATILRHEKLQRILLVTSSLHMPRASASFRHQGLAVIPASVADPLSLAADSWLPHRAVLRESARCLHEYFGLWVYVLRGWA